MKDAVEAILSDLGMILRYIAPGFAGLFVVAAVIPDKRTFLLSGSAAVVVLGMLLGPTIYGVHTGALLRLLWLPIMIRFHKKQTKMSPKDTIVHLDEQRWLRRASKVDEVISIQGEMNKWGAMLNFLYCLSYMMILIPVGAKLIQLYHISLKVSWNWIIILIGGCVVLAAALVSEHRILWWEIKLARRYPNGEKT